MYIITKNIIFPPFFCFLTVSTIISLIVIVFVSASSVVLGLVEVEQQQKQWRIKKDQLRQKLFSSSTSSISTKNRKALGASSSSSDSKIRFHLDYSHLDNSSLFCSQTGDVRPTAWFGDTTCTAADVLTSEKRQIYVEKLIPSVLELLENAILLKSEEVIPENTNIIVPSDACSDTAMYVPPEHSTTGFNDTDLVVYISAFPAPDWVLGWAMGCSTLPATGRTIVAQLNIPPHQISWNSANSTYIYNTNHSSPNWSFDTQFPSVDRMKVRATLHEFLHAIGLDKHNFRSRNLIQGDYTMTNETIYRRGKRITLFNGSKATEAAQLFFNCSTLDGIELEDENGEGVALDHWESRVVHQEIMNSIIGRSFISNITLAALEDLGHYKRAPDYEKYIEPITFGKDFGCSLFFETCNTTAGGRNEYFCFDETMTDECSFDFAGSRTFCDIVTNSDDAPSYAQYFPGEPKKGGPAYNGDDYCPLLQDYYDANRCRVHDRVATDEQVELGNVYSMNSRCFYTRNFSRQQESSSSSLSSKKNTTCLESRCVLWGETNQQEEIIYGVEFKNPSSEVWYSNCPLSNQTTTSSEQITTITIDGFYGHVICPKDPKKFCFYNKILGGDEVDMNPTTTTTSSTTTTIITTTTTTTTPIPTTTTDFPWTGIFENSNAAADQLHTNVTSIILLIMVLLLF